MLQTMRDNASSWIIKILLIAIAIVFVLWGVGNYGEKGQTEAAVVNGEPISMDAYRQTYNNLVEQQAKRYGGKLDAKTLEMLNLEQQAMDSLIEKQLMLQEARRLNIRVSDKAIADQIQQMEVFRENGKFSNSRYKRILAANRLAPDEFERMQRESLIIENLRRMIESGIKVSDDEARKWYNWNNQSVQLDYVFFDMTRYNPEVEEDEIKAYFEEHKDKYKTDPEIQVAYIHFAPEQFMDKVKVEDAEIKSYYNSNPDEFFVEKKVKARHILFKVDKEADPELVKSQHKKALEVLEKARSGQDFAELAKKYSEGPTSEKGGDLGEFTKDQMVKPFSDAAFSLKPGEISEPVLTDFGWHLIKVEDVTEERTKPFEEVKEEIANKLKMKKAERMAFEEADDFRIQLYSDDKLETLGEKHGYTVSATEFFTKKNPPQELKSDRQRFASRAFQLEKGIISSVEKINNGYYLLQVIGENEAKPAALSDVKETVKTEVLGKKRRELAKKAADDFLSSVKEEGSTMEEAAKEAELELKTTDFFNRNENIPEIGYEPGIAKAAFELTLKTPFPEEPIQTQRGFYVIRLNQVKVPDDEEFAQKREETYTRLKRVKEYRAFQSWLEELKSNSEIEKFIASS